MSGATGSVLRMTTTYYVASSIDGFIADRDGGLDWLLEFGMEEFTPHYEAFLARVGVVVMGATTYEFVVGEGLESWPYDGMQTRVLTHRDLPLAVAGADIRFESGDATTLHAEWVEAAGDRDVWIVGGGAIAAALADAGLLDVLASP
jgi:dihydrofolate reductase